MITKGQIIQSSLPVRDRERALIVNLTADLHSPVALRQRIAFCPITNSALSLASQLRAYGRRFNGTRPDALNATSHIVKGYPRGSLTYREPAPSARVEHVLLRRKQDAHDPLVNALHVPVNAPDGGLMSFPGGAPPTSRVSPWRQSVGRRTQPVIAYAPAPIAWRRAPGESDLHLAAVACIQRTDPSHVMAAS